MRTVIIIPARYASTRFPGKPLCELKLPQGGFKSLINLSWEAACAVPDVAEVVVATDDDRIKDAASRFGARVVLTSPECVNGTERCADALVNHGIEADLVINLQGDAPLTPAWFVENLIAEMSSDPSLKVATPVIRCSNAMYEGLRDDRIAGRVGGTTVVFNNEMQALYFSKELLPYLSASGAEMPVFQHVGCYAYRPDALEAYASWSETPLEINEGLEQLRFLENGWQIKCVPVDRRGRFLWELNNPSDVTLIEQELKTLI